jgi:hypothetical protein
VLNKIESSDGDGNYDVTWAKSEGIVDYYTLEEDDEPSFQSPNVIYTGIDTLNSIIGRDIGTYYYRINSTNGIGSSDWSEIMSVEVAPPPPPSLYYIENSDGDGIYEVSWTKAEGNVDYYTLEEADDLSFSNPEVIYTGIDTLKSITGKKDTGTYYYRVNATNNIGTSVMSR